MTLCFPLRVVQALSVARLNAASVCVGGVWAVRGVRVGMVGMVGTRKGGLARYRHHLAITR